MQIAVLKQNKILAKSSNKYSDFLNTFLEKEAVVLPEQTNLNEYYIKMESDEQPSYKPIYNLRLVELKTLKAYIKTHLKTGFI